MFVCNIKLKGKHLFKTILIVSFIIAISLFLLAGFKIITELLGNKTYVTDEIPSPDIAEIAPENYTNILREVHEDIDTYVGQKISFSGYIYRVSDLKEDEFVLARDMIINDIKQTVVVGFLCKYEKSKEFENNTWVKITGEIKKGYYYGDIPYIEITEINKTATPDNPLVCVPDETYVPTAIIY